MRDLSLAGLVLCACCAAAGIGRAGETNETADRKLVWAHHTPWHTPHNTSLSVLKYYNYPLCDATGENVADWRAEFRQALDQGVDGFWVDVVAKKDGGRPAFTDAVQGMLRAAEGTPFLVGVCLDVKTSVDQQVRDLKDMLDRFGRHPNYPLWQGRPVVATYTFQSWTPAEWREIRDRLKAEGHDIFLVANFEFSYQTKRDEDLRPYLPVVDMIYAFSLYGLDGTSPRSKAELFDRLAREGNVERAATLGTGYYGAWLNGRNDFYQPHRGLDGTHEYFDILTATATARWLQITTWNDHDETSFLPMVFTPGNPRLTKIYSDLFKGRETVTGTPEVVFAYHREALPGTLLRFEAMSLPTLREGAVTVTGRLLDVDEKPVADLAARELSGNAFDRAEWLVPSTALAATPALIPEVTVTAKDYTRTTRLPALFLVTGWLQNPVTLRVAAGDSVVLPAELAVADRDGLLQATLTPKGDAAPWRGLKRATLWRNERPIALFDAAAFGPDAGKRYFLNLVARGQRDFTLTPVNGEIVMGVKNFSANGTDDLTWTPTGLATRKNLAWSMTATVLAGTPELRFRLAIPGTDPLTLSARELAQREKTVYEGVTLECPPVDATLQNRPALDHPQGAATVGVFSRPARPNDRFQVFYEMKDGKSGWSNVYYPFAGTTAPVATRLVETAVNLETTSGASGMPGQSEFLAADVPFRTPSMQPARLSPRSVRGGHWDFENDGRDQLGDMPVDLPAAMMVDGMAGKGRALRFTGKETVKMRLRTWPIGPSTVDVLLKPAPGRDKPQGVLTRSGWSDGIGLYLHPDGRLAVVRDGGKEVPAVTLTGKSALPDDAWTRVRVVNDGDKLSLYLDGALDAATDLPVARTYGNSTWYLGRGEKGYANYTGLMDDLTVLGLPVHPGDGELPAFTPAQAYPPLTAATAFAVDEASLATGKWNYPEAVQARDGDEDAAGPSDEPLAQPARIGANTLLLGPGLGNFTMKAEGVALDEGQLLAIPFRRFVRAEPAHGWYAVLFRLDNAAGKSLNFNFGEATKMMITANEPKWTIKTGHVPLELPTELKIAKRGGNLVFLVGDKVVYRAPDDPDAPYTQLVFHASTADKRNAVAVQLGDPRRYTLR